MASTETRSQAFHEVDWSNPTDVVDFVALQAETQHRRKEELEREWLQNILWYRGEQYREWSVAHGLFQDPPAPEWRARLVCNLIMPYVRTEVARLLRTKPIWTVTPATADTQDIEVSRISDKVLIGYWRHLEVSPKLMDAAFWMVITGNSFFKCTWDGQAGGSLSFQANDLAEADGGQQDGMFDKLRSMLGLGAQDDVPDEIGANLGDASIEVISPFEMDVGIGALSVQDAPWLLHSKVHDPGKVEMEYGIKVDPDLDDARPGYVQRRLENMMGTGDTEDETSGVLVHELWTQPVKGFPTGLTCIVAGKKLLVRPRENPYRRNETPYKPFFHLKQLPIPGQFWGMSVVDSIKPLQAEYNKGRSQLVENRNMMSKPKWLIHTSSGVKKVAITSEPGERISWGGSPLFKPEMVTPPSIPSYVQNMLDLDRRDIQDVAAQHDVTQAKAPPGLKSGVAITALQEGDQRDMGPTGQSMDYAGGELGGFLLQLLSEKVSEERLVKIIGDDRVVETKWFKGEQLSGENAGKPNVSYFDVTADTFSQLPMSKTATIEFVGHMIDRGILHPQQHRRQIIQMIGMGEAQTLLAEGSLDRSRQLMEISFIVKGTEIAPERYERHDVHMEVLNEYRRGSEYEQLEDEIKKQLEFHGRGHESMAAAEAVRPQILLALAQQQQALIIAQEAGADPATLMPSPAGPPGAGEESPQEG